MEPQDVASPFDTREAWYERELSNPEGVLGGLIAAFLAPLLLTVVLVLVGGVPEAVLNPLLVVSALLAALSAPVLLVLLPRLRVRAYLAPWRASLRATPHRDLAAVVDGDRVCVRGVAAASRLVEHPTLGEAIAWQQVHAEGGGRRGGARHVVRSAGGTFDLAGDHGATVRVDARYALVSGPFFELTTLVPDGATVRVVGNARWEALSPDDAPKGFREASGSARRLTLEGSPGAPVVIERVGA